MCVGGLVLIPIQVALVGWDQRIAPIAIVLALVGAHSLWCRLKKIRSPRTMLALDLTLWGWIMTLLTDLPAVTAASVAFLALITVIFSNGWWTGAFLVYLASWYGISFFTRTGVDLDSIMDFQSVLFTVAGLGLVIWRIKKWLGSLDASRSQMLGTVSHELRNNLTGMIGVTELVGSQELEPQNARELISLAHLQAVDAAEIVEDLLTASRLEGAALSVEMAPVDLNQEVATTSDRFTKDDATITLDLAEGLPLAHADALRVRQVLRNLLSNADRYGGPTVKVRTYQEADLLRVVVSDDGDGVPLDDEGTIFLPYRRSASPRRHSSSVGLGLWISRQLAHAMGGRLEYRRVNGCTEFALSLPTSIDAELSQVTLRDAAGARVRESVSRLGDLVTHSALWEVVASSPGVRA